MTKSFTALEKKKFFLKKYKKNESCIDSLENRIAELDDKITSLKSINLSGMPRGGIPITTEDLIAKKDDLERRKKIRENRRGELKEKIINEIDRLDDPRYLEVLELFFIECMTFEDIADELGYTDRHVTRIYTEGLNALVTLDNKCL